MFRNSELQERSLLFHAGTYARSISKALSKQILASSGHEPKRTKGTTPYGHSEEVQNITDTKEEEV